ncbi:ATP-dependent DNA helicase [Polymorphobacter sp. PAMC 29334]|uniref:ATP-dependent DNA helicase n=1 Tax=Polymorphobacter sp. PAMC 29334 TaxID=2862331 RepID=UPI001C76F17B|nr:ATP-dependent DNA helicase [Polymorphobacter sp. PAMC 29334]QYE35540.1 ATP-dependent DNA helicase [Polymorphobacter sp. PAMC 29334]
MPAGLPYPALVANHAGIWIDAVPVSRGEAIRRAADTPHLLLNAAVTASRLGYPELSGMDLLELFAFVHPARFVVPTTGGLARVLDLPVPGDGAAESGFLRDAAALLLDRLGAADWRERHGAYGIAQALGRLRWSWGSEVARRIKAPERPERTVFTTLPKWEDAPPRAKPRDVAVADGEVDARLDRMLGIGAERREGQRAYARAAAHAFRPRSLASAPNVALIEAGTGIGKTLGYLAPATLWAETAQGTVWLSTYTKALQRQLDHETARAYDPTVKAAKVVVRKGRENYLCLLNLEDAVQGGFAGRPAIFAQLAARWAEYSRDGDMVGGDLPGWLMTLFGRPAFAALTDRRGECVYAGCPHYRTCFIERSTRASIHADLVIANHALVMINAVRGRAEGAAMTRIVFDEGHHLFDAADATFAVALTGNEAIEVRRWILGPEKTARGRRRGLSARLSDLISYDTEGALALEEASRAARALPADGWGARLVAGIADGPVELLLAAVRAQVFARAADRPGHSEAGYSLETEVAEVQPAVVEAAEGAAQALEALSRPLAALEARLVAVLDDAPDWLDGAARARVEGAAAGLRLRCQTLGSWVGLLARLGGPADADFIDWFAVDRIEGRELDVGVHRHWLDPTRPLAKAVFEPAHGVVVTSATLRARTAVRASAGNSAANGADSGAPDDDWRTSELRTGVTHLALPPQRFAVDSPFDYATNARVLIVTDIKRGDIPALATAYRRLIEAADGGTLGLFTAIARLRAVHARIADPLAKAGFPLYAQHVDPIDTGTLVDIFRAEPRASLIGTDALRDGVDVPGQSLRLVVMEGVPWPRPTVLHAARRAAFGGAAYDDLVTAGRLAQAFGRLIRRADDRGTFVLIGPAVPSRLLTAFPAGTRIDRVGIDDAVAAVSDSQHIAAPVD